jgi:lysophospholipase L1-like esterase
MLLPLIAALALAALQPQQPTAPAAPKPAEQHQPASNPATIPAARTDRGWIDRNARYNARAKQGAEKGDMSIIFLGDSITEGWEGAGKQVWNDRFAPLGAVNLGIGGDRTQHVLYRIDNGNLDGLAKPAAGNPPKLVVLMIGTNNTHDDSAERIAEGIQAIVQHLAQKLPQTPVLVLGVFPRAERPSDPARFKIADINHRVSMWIEDRAKERSVKPRAEFLDIGDKFLETDGTISKETMPDSLHLSPKGYQIWADAIAPKIAEMTGHAGSDPKRDR